jgi:rubredoxin
MFKRMQCNGCGYTFRGLPSHAYCGNCADIIEFGGEMPEYYHTRAVRKVAPVSLSLTSAEAEKVAAWKSARAIHNTEAAKLRRAKAAWNMSASAPAPSANVVRRRPKA